MSKSNFRFVYYLQIAFIVISLDLYDLDFWEPFRIPAIAEVLLNFVIEAFIALLWYVVCLSIHFLRYHCPICFSDWSNKIYIISIRDCSFSLIVVKFQEFILPYKQSVNCIKASYFIYIYISTERDIYIEIIKSIEIMQTFFFPFLLLFFNN